MSGKLAITLKRSVIGSPQDQRRTVEGLGLRKLNQTVILPDNPSTRGAAFKIRHLLEVREVTEE
jgi:large subunit ribosomal protein L30